MLPTEFQTRQYHEVTKHSYLSVIIDPNYVDPIAQPSAFKFYPKFYRRFPLKEDNPEHSFIRQTSQITWAKVYKDGLSYHLRVNPSAGALYPTEVYVQIRGVKGWIDGIYHFEVANDCLTLLDEITDDGLEGYLLPDRRVNGFIFIVSCVYYRSSWKYKKRSIRYCFLDGGHHLGAIEAVAYCHDRPVQIVFDFDKIALNEDFGFENKEFAIAGVVAGEVESKSIRRLRSPLPFVCGTDYFEADPFIETAYRDTLQPQSYSQAIRHPQFDCDRDRFLQAILNRRSARKFKRREISADDYRQLLDRLNQPISSESFEAIEIYAVVNRVSELQPGLYRGMKLLRAGDLSDRAGYLCLNQALGRDSAVTFFMVADYRNYQTALQMAGLLGQRLYLMSANLGIGCSGIGAYYDDESREFLESDREVIYVLAVGK